MHSASAQVVKLSLRYFQSDKIAIFSCAYEGLEVLACCSKSGQVIRESSNFSNLLIA